MQLQLETASVCGTEWAGVSLDLSKAYNTLPRSVLQVINQRLGLGGYWTPHSSVLDGRQRHMVIQSIWGQGVYANTGVPEGCPHAVVQMILVTWVFTAAIQKGTNIALHSFVDDWVIADEDNDRVARAVALVHCMTKKFGLILSLEKSSAFGSSNKVAKKLSLALESHQFHIPTTCNFQGLGVQFHARGTFSTTVRNTRIEKAKRCLIRLQNLPWTASRKTAIINRVFSL